MMYLETVVFGLVLVFGLKEAFSKVVLSQELISKVYITENNMHDGQILRRDTRSISAHFGHSSTYIGTSNDHTCYVCRPGFYRTGDCSVNMTVGECQKCQSGTYNSNYNIAIRCAGCATHCVDRNAEIVRQCNASADMVCHCKDGYYNHSKGPGEWICLPHTRCDPGTEPSQQGTAEVDTKCQQCSEGWYSPSKSSTDRCKPCSVCDSGQVSQKDCNRLENTICASKVKTDLFLKFGVPTIIIFVIAAVIVLLVYLAWKRFLKRLFDKCRNERQTTESTSNAENVQVSFLTISQDQQTHRAQQSIDDTILEQNWTTVFKIIIRYMNKEEWKSIFRTLFSKYESTNEIESRIVAICYDYQGLNEHIYQSFNSWLKRAGDQAYLDDIIEALSKDNMNGLANYLKNKFDTLLRPSSPEFSPSTEV